MEAIVTKLTADCALMYEQMQTLAKKNDTLSAQVLAFQAASASAAVATAATASSSPRNAEPFTERMRMPAPPKFDGMSKKGQDTLSNWEFDMYCYFEACGMDDIKRQLRFTITLLDGPAKTCWRSHVVQTSDSVTNDRLPSQCDSFTSLVADILRHEFENANSQRMARDELANCTQTGSAIMYVQRFRSICLTIKDLAPSERLDRFVRGLNVLLRRELAVHPPKDFDEACSVVERLEAAEHSVRNPRQFQTHFGRTPSSEQSDPMDLSNLMQRGSVRRDNNRSNGRNHQAQLPPRQRNTVHSITNDSKKPSSNLNRPNFAKLTDAERERLRAVNACFYCRTPEADHTSSTCPLRSKPQHSNVQRGPN